MSNDAIKAALALAALSTTDQDWVRAQLGEQALARLQRAEASLQGHDLNQVAARYEPPQEAVDSLIGRLELALVAQPEQVKAVLATQPEWFQTVILTSFEANHRFGLSSPRDLSVASLRAMPMALRLACLTALEQACAAADNHYHDGGEQ